MKDDRLVSIIIPVYNAERFIDATVQNAVQQTYENIEVIFVDDGSNDNTKNKIEMHQNDLRIKYFYKENGGPAAARNYGIAKAAGDYVAFLDADDKWMPEKIEKQVKLFEVNPNLGMTFTNSYYSDYETNKIHGSALPSGLTKENIAKVLMLNGCCILTSTVMIKKNVFATVGCFDESLWFAEDWELFFRVANTFQVDFVDECLSTLQSVRGSLSGTKEKRLQRIEQERKVVEKIYANAPKYGVTNKDKKLMLQKLLINSARGCLFNKDYSVARKFLINALAYNFFNMEIFRLLVFSFINTKR